MPIYYFDLEFKDTAYKDDKGDEYPCLELAIAEMRRTLMYIARLDRPNAEPGWELVGSLRNTNKHLWRGRVQRIRCADANTGGEVLAFA